MRNATHKTAIRIAGQQLSNTLRLATRTNASAPMIGAAYLPDLSEVCLSAHLQCARAEANISATKPRTWHRR